MKHKIREILLELQKDYKKKENWHKAEHRLYMLFKENKKVEEVTYFESEDPYGYDSPPMGGFKNW